MQLHYAPPETNVFCANGDDVLYLGKGLEQGKWYYATVSWQTFMGPYHCREEADTNFQLYIRDVRFCDGCGE